MRYTPFFDVEAWCSQPFGCTEFAQTRPGYNIDEATGLRYHEGADFYVKGGRTTWPLFAFTAGEIAWAGWGDTYGWNIMLWDKRHRMSYRFCHLDRIDVKQGESVRVGRRLGMCGNSGKSTAPHLHMNAVPMAVWGTKMVEWNGRKGRVDPLGILIDKGIHV